MQNVFKNAWHPHQPFLRSAQQGLLKTLRVCLQYFIYLSGKKLWEYSPNVDIGQIYACHVTNHFVILNKLNKQHFKCIYLLAHEAWNSKHKISLLTAQKMCFNKIKEHLSNVAQGL